MKIASMVRGYLPVPRPADIVYAPVDLAMAICEGLAQKGHDVTFYGPEGSKPPVKLSTLGLRPLAHNQAEFHDLVTDVEKHVHYIPGMWDYYLARDMFERANKGEFDILHFHHVESALIFASMFPKVPVVYTMHDPLNGWYRETFKMYESRNQFFVSISNNQRKAAPELPYIATVYNGIHLKDYDYSDSSSDYLLFAGRIVPEKGAAEAIQVAIKSNNKLLIAGPLYEDKMAYFDQHIKPFLNDDIQYLGYIPRDQLATYLQKAKAFLMPINWEEPFGLTMIEAMASGTPVIAFARGSVPEVMKDGKTGYVVETLDEMVKAVSRIDQISRRDCREHAEKYFTVQTMVNGYEQAFKDILKKPGFKR